MCDVLYDVFIGLLSGIVSSGIVTIIYDKRTKKKEHERNFNSDKQEYHRYILRIKDELFFAYKSNDYDNLLREIENEPIRESFTDLDDQSRKMIQEISDYISKLKETIRSTNNSMSEEEYKIYRGKIFRYSIDALNFKEVKK